MSTRYLRLERSEGILVQCAATIYAAYISSGQVSSGAEQEWMERSIREAYFIADTTDSAIQSDEELAAPPRR
jgi:hypothetical protein